MHVKYTNLFTIYIGDNTPGKVYFHIYLYIYEIVHMKMLNSKTILVDPIKIKME